MWQQPTQYPRGTRSPKVTLGFLSSILGGPGWSIYRLEDHLYCRNTEIQWNHPPMYNLSVQLINSSVQGLWDLQWEKTWPSHDGWVLALLTSGLCFLRGHLLSSLPSLRCGFLRYELVCPSLREPPRQARSVASLEPPVNQGAGLQLLLRIIRLLREFIEMCDLAYFASENRRLMLVPWRKLCGLERERKKIIHQSDLFPRLLCSAQN